MKGLRIEGATGGDGLRVYRITKSQEPFSAPPAKLLAQGTPTQPPIRLFEILAS